MEPTKGVFRHSGQHRWRLEVCVVCWLRNMFLGVRPDKKWWTKPHLHGASGQVYGTPGKARSLHLF